VEVVVEEEEEGEQHSAIALLIPYTVLTCYKAVEEVVVVVEMTELMQRK